MLSPMEHKERGHYVLWKHKGEDVESYGNIKIENIESYGNIKTEDVESYENIKGRILSPMKA